jgi:transposase-like protein
MAIDFKGSRFERDIILWGVRWYVAYPISYRRLEEMMGERGVEVDHSMLNRWIVRYVPLLCQVPLTRSCLVLGAGNAFRTEEPELATIPLPRGHTWSASGSSVG